MVQEPPTKEITVAKAPIPRPRARSRAVDVAVPENTAPDHIAHIKAWFAENRIANKHIARAKKLRGIAHQAALKANALSGEFEFVDEASGARMIVDYVVEAPVSDTADSNKLFDLYKAGTITEDQFKAAISTSLKAVKDACGSNVATLVTVPKTGDETLSCKPRK